jgi:serine-type D-Ala-D-Ala carboxypeptidase/endopeptidase (penicillin-binding protein 4)
MNMNRAFFFLMLLYAQSALGQNPAQKVKLPYEKMQSSPLLSHASSAFYVIDAATGKVVYKHNEEAGLPAGSCQKLLTSAAAFELLGKDYRYASTFYYDNGVLYVKGSGDPTLGSDRYASSSEKALIAQLKHALDSLKIKDVSAIATVHSSTWSCETIPDGWIWQDIGSYYGAGAAEINWRENQYDLLLHSGSRIGDPVSVAGSVPEHVEGLQVESYATAAQKGTGDNTYIYYKPGAQGEVLRGTIPLGETSFRVSGSLPDPAKQVGYTLSQAFHTANVQQVATVPATARLIFTHYSPSLDSINYWFLKKSINLYGEALLRALPLNSKGQASIDSGVATLKSFWTNRGIDAGAINIYDGSGLSPANRITARSLVSVLQYAANKKWFSSFYDALPEINGLKMKSGTIGGVIAYAGYSKSRNGNYIFAIIVNNYQGSSSVMRQEIWKVLDNLK